MTKFKLFAALAVDGPARITLCKGKASVVGVLMSVEREDGSGASFNVKVRTDNGEIVTVYVRTID